MEQIQDGRQYKDAFVEVAEELCGRTSGERRYTDKQKPRMVDGRGGEGSVEKREAWKMIECIKDIGEQTPTSLEHMYGQKKKTARRAVDRARKSMEEYRKLDEDGGKKMIEGGRPIQDGTGYN